MYAAESASTQATCVAACADGTLGGCGSLGGSDPLGCAGSLGGPSATDGTASPNATSDGSYRMGLDRRIVHHCAPTLAALKPANLFTCRDDSTRRGILAPSRDEFERAFARELAECRERVASCDVRIDVLARRCSGILLYVWRPSLLARSISQPDVARYLASEGYDASSLPDCIARLRSRINGTDAQSQATGTCSFPHEIGFFLGYPYEDVVGFIANNGENSLCTGCWKVYARQRDAEECFCCYKNCTAAYDDLFAEGVPIECLATVDENFPAEEAYRMAG